MNNGADVSFRPRLIKKLKRPFWPSDFAIALLSRGDFRSSVTMDGKRS